MGKLEKEKHIMPFWKEDKRTCPDGQKECECDIRCIRDGFCYSFDPCSQHTILCFLPPNQRNGCGIETSCTYGLVMVEDPEYACGGMCDMKDESCYPTTTPTMSTTTASTTTTTTRPETSRSTTTDIQSTTLEGKSTTQITSTTVGQKTTITPDWPKTTSTIETTTPDLSTIMRSTTLPETIVTTSTTAEPTSTTTGPTSTTESSTSQSSRTTAGDSYICS